MPNKDHRLGGVLTHLALLQSQSDWICVLGWNGTYALPESQTPAEILSGGGTFFSVHVLS